MCFKRRTTITFFVVSCCILCLKSQDHSKYLDCCKQWYDTLVANPYIIPSEETIVQIDESITALRKHQPVYNIALAKCLQTKANYLSNISKLRASTEIAKEAESVWMASDSRVEHLELLGWIYNLIAYNADQSYDFTTAVLYSEKTQQLAWKLNLLPSVVNEYNNLCKAYTNLGEFEKALLCVQSGMTILDTATIDAGFSEPDRLMFENLLNNSLALLYFQQSEKLWNSGRISESLTYNEKARKIWKIILATMQRGELSRENMNVVTANLGAAFFKYRHQDLVYTDSACYTLQKADTLFENREGYAGSPLHGYVKSLLGYAFSTKNYEQSLAYFDAGMPMIGYYPTRNLEERRLMLEKATMQSRLLLSLLNKANSYVTLYHQKKEIGLLKQGFSILKDLVQDMEYLNLSELSSDAVVAQRNLLESIYLSAIQTSVLLFESTNDLYYYEQAFSFLEKHKSFMLRQGIRKRYALRKESADKQNSILEQEASFEKEYQDLRYLLNHNTGAASREQLVNLIIEHRERRQAFIDELKNSEDKSKRALFFDRHDHSTPTLATVKENYLNEDEALITYSIGGNHPLALAVWQDSQLVVRFDIDNSFWKSFDRLQQCAQYECSSDEYATAAYDVHEHILKDVVAQLPKEIRTLLIIPDNELRALSFDMLLTAPGRPDLNGNMPFLIREFALKYCYSIGTMAWIKQLEKMQSGKERKVIAAFIASPGTAHFGNAACSNTPLPYLSDATKEFMKYFPEEERALFAPASRLDFIGHCNQFRILHITAHGCTDAENPMDYFLQFAPDQTASGGDRLTVKYIYDSLDLYTDLLVLASCNTKNGRLEGGEGLASITRAFVQNGVGQVLVTLHEVNDFTSAKLLLFFYEELVKNTLPPAVALANAKTRFLVDKTIDDQYKAPNFWSNFVLIGDD